MTPSFDDVGAEKLGGVWRFGYMDLLVMAPASGPSVDV